MAEQIVKTNVLKVEIFHMPVIDLSVRYCYRFIEPVPMIWQADGRISAALALGATFNGRDSLTAQCKQLLGKYKDIIQNTKNQGLWSEDLEWLFDVNEVNMITCELNPTGEFNWKELYENQLKREG